MNNMLKYSEASKFTVVFSLQAEQLFVLIHDNGKGFDTASKAKNLGGAGLKNMKARVDKLGGHIDIQSDNLSGTKISILLPLSI